MGNSVGMTYCGRTAVVMEDMERGDGSWRVDLSAIDCNGSTLLRGLPYAQARKYGADWVRDGVLPATRKRIVRTSRRR